VHNLLKANGLPATNFAHHFVPSPVNTGKELILFDTGNGKGRIASAGYRRDLEATFLKPEDEIVSGIRAINAYGHSPGMRTFPVESDNQRLLISAGRQRTSGRPAANG